MEHVHVPNEDVSGMEHAPNEDVSRMEHVPNEDVSKMEHVSNEEVSKMERVPNEDMKKKILSTLKQLHISCAYDCLEAAKSKDDFIGICVLHENGDKILEENGRRVKSGYIFITKSSGLTDEMRGNTLSRKAYNMLFKEIEHFAQVTIVGFSQENRQLKSRLGTFNTDISTNLTDRDSKYCLVVFRTLIYGAIIMYNLCGHRNTSPYAASLCVCLSLIIKNEENFGEQLSTFPSTYLDLENQETLAYVKAIFMEMDVHTYIIEVACAFESYSLLKQWSRVSYAIKLILDDLRSEISGAEFKRLLDYLSVMFNSNDMLKHLWKEFLD